MKNILALAFLITGCPVCGLWAGTNGIVESVMFETRVTPPVWQVPGNLKHNEQLFRARLGTLLLFGGN